MDTKCKTVFIKEKQSKSGYCCHSQDRGWGDDGAGRGSVFLVTLFLDLGIGYTGKFT